MLFSCFQAPGAAGATAGTAINVNVALRVKPLEQDYTGTGTVTVMGEGTVATCALVPATRDVHWYPRLAITRVKPLL